MSLLVLTSGSVLSLFPLIDFFFSFGVLCSCFFLKCLVCSDWMLDVRINLVMCYMFCIPELCSEMQFSNLAKVWFFGTLFLRCVYLNSVFTWTMLRLKLIIPDDWVRVFPSSLECPMTHEVFPAWLMEADTYYPWPCVSTRRCCHWRF